MLLKLILLFSTAAGAADLSVPLSTAYSNSQDEIAAAVCKSETPFRQCRFKEASSCQAAANDAFNECYKSDLATRTTTDVTPSQAREIAKSLLECTTQSPKLRAANALEARCYAQATRKNPTLKIDTSYLAQYKALDLPKVTATPPPQALLPLDQRYLLEIKNFTTLMDQLGSRLKNGDRSVCPGYQGPDLSGCAKEALSHIEITSSSELTLAAAVNAAAMAKDRSRFGQETAAALATDSLLSLLEHYDLKRHFLVKAELASQYDRIQQPMLKSDENILSKNAKLKISQELQQTMLSAAASRKPASVPGLRVPTEAQLRARFKKEMQRDWSI